MKVLYPGTFDPITFGHIDLIDRASRIFDEVLVGVSYHSSKETLFSFKERVYLVKEVLKKRKNISVEGFKGLVVDFARKKDIKVIVRGLRMISDFEYEFQMALTNRKLAPDIEVMFLMPQEKFSYVSSTLIKQAFSLGADLRCFLPNAVISYMRKSKKSKIK